MCIFDIKGDKKVAKAHRVQGQRRGEEVSCLTENDLVFVTNGSCTEGTIYGDQNHAPNGRRGSAHQRLLEPVEEHRKAGSVFWTSGEVLLGYGEDQLGICNRHHVWMTRSFRISQNICKRDPRSGKVVTGGIVSCQDSKLAAELDDQPSGTVQGSGEG